MAKTAKAATLTEQVLKQAGGKKKSGSHKAGRNKVKCQAYLASGRKLKNKLVKLKKHLAVHFSDKCAEYALAEAKRGGKLLMEYTPA